jgi:CDP-glucose 4,6-dehydratase
VLVTGHTGFKGSWLSTWLTELGADVIGYALEPPTEPSAFVSMHVAERVTDLRGDVRDLEDLKTAMARHRPEVVFHLAAQPLVRRSYEEPHLTYETNVMGTVNVLESVRAVDSVRAVVVITSDKCYENREWAYAYRENDAMGGYDPYSSSKGCAELITAAYRSSLFSAEGSPSIVSVRAGNIIGGGDWAVDRLIPDCVRAVSSGHSVPVRNPAAVRPWQHVLDPLAGYLWLGARLLQGERSFASSWNFGPGPGGHVAVAEVVDAFVRAYGGGSWHIDEPAEPQPHEATTLMLDITKAANLLGWRPVWGTVRAVDETAAWYRVHADERGDPVRCTLDQIATYTADASREGLAWASSAGE